MRHFIAQGDNATALREFVLSECCCFFLFLSLLFVIRHFYLSFSSIFFVLFYYLVLTYLFIALLCHKAGISVKAFLIRMQATAKLTRNQADYVCVY